MAQLKRIYQNQVPCDVVLVEHSHSYPSESGFIVTCKLTQYNESLYNTAINTHFNIAQGSLLYMDGFIPTKKNGTITQAFKCGNEELHDVLNSLRELYPKSNTKQYTECVNNLFIVYLAWRSYIALTFDEESHCSLMSSIKVL